MKSITIIPPPSEKQILDTQRIRLASPEVRLIFTRFVRTISGEIGEIRRAAKGKNWGKLMQVAHKLQGTAGNCGFTGLMSKASQLQDSVRAGKLGGTLETELEELKNLGNLSVLEFDRLTKQEI